MIDTYKRYKMKEKVLTFWLFSSNLKIYTILFFNFKLCKLSHVPDSKKSSLSDSRNAATCQLGPCRIRAEISFS